MKYKHHCITNIFSLLASHVGLYYMQVGLHQQASFAGAFLFATFLMNPDLDLPHSTPTRNWGILKFLWKPYNKKLKHRGISHFPVFGTLTRIFYLTLFIALMLSIYDLWNADWNETLNDLIMQENSKIKGVLDWILTQGNLLLFALGGLVLADLLHLLSDLCYSLLRS